MHPTALVSTVVHSEPYTIKGDYTSAELRALAGDMAQAPPHPILGFYAASTGYQSTVKASADSACDFVVDIHLVSTKRVIEIAKDLANNQCLKYAALRHYRLHEAMQTAWLQHSRRSLRVALQTFLDRNAVAEQVGMQALVTGFMTQWIDRYEAGLPDVRDAGDTLENLYDLNHACHL